MRTKKTENYISTAFRLLKEGDKSRAAGYALAAKICGVTPAAPYRWERRGHLPRTEATGETRYAELLAKANPKISEKRLLETVFRR